MMKRYISLYRAAFLRKVIPISGIIVIVSSLQLNNKRTRGTRIHDCLNSSGIVLVKQISKLFSDVDQLLFLTRPRRFHTDPIMWRSVTNSAPLWRGGLPRYAFSAVRLGSLSCCQSDASQMVDPNLIVLFHVHLV